MAFAPYGEYWKGIKKIVMSELLSLKRVQSFQATRTEEVKLAMNAIAHSSGPVNLSELTLSLTNDVVCRVAFGKRYEGGGGGGGSEFCGLLRERQELLGGFCLADFFPGMGWVNKFNGLERRVEKNFIELDKFYDKVIEDHIDGNFSERVGGAEHEDLVAVLLRVQKDQSEATALSNHQIKGVLNDIFIAGTDTASATMIWTMSELIKNPETMRKAQQEVRQVKKKETVVEESDIPKLIYLKQVVKESLRLHPPAPLLLPRETTESCTVNGFEIPAKTRVFVNAKAIATDMNCWEDPDKFLPERFEGSGGGYTMDLLGGKGFEMLPFGAGRRGCPGVNFAMPLIELMLANLLFRFDWELPRGVGREDVDMEEAFGITMHKKDPLWLKPIAFHV